ncbi:phage pi2 protein 07 [Evansella vedderi]|uniref:Phage pi2 protein 07 n=1 Tax=Evansella vedderi TaxID=38282 RepID=A0ABU0A362_9BACI|nr:group-specific protein [Evansella vedderi]MDQ0257924.1 phage pi2 protein 07 [Evansella vedderi]
MIKVDIDQEEVRKMILEKVEEVAKDVDKELIFWDSKELTRRTCMSWNTVVKTFFHDPRCPRYKVGGKWYFSAEEMKKFLLVWLSEQGR